MRQNKSRQESIRGGLAVSCLLWAGLNDQMPSINFKF